MKKITLYNFRCFENFEWDFTPGINLIVGDNSSGKTSLLRACRLVAGSFLPDSAMRIQCGPDRNRLISGMSLSMG